MAARTAYVATEANGDVLTPANFNKMPGGIVAYAQATSDQGSITSQADLTSLAVTVTANTSRLFHIAAYATFLKDATPAQCNLYIMEGATQLAIAQMNIAASQIQQATPFCLVSPSAGSHTYKLQALSGAGNLTSKASSVNQAWIVITDGGPAF